VRQQVHREKPLIVSYLKTARSSFQHLIEAAGCALEFLQFLSRDLLLRSFPDGLQTPHRFPTKRQLWAYSGFAVETHDSGEYRYVRGKLQRNRERITVRGLRDHYNRDLKNLFKGAAISASTRPGPIHDIYVALVAKGMRPDDGSSHPTQKTVTITLIMWKKGVNFDL
jgi:hypothetical protein